VYNLNGVNEKNVMVVHDIIGGWFRKGKIDGLICDFDMIPDGVKIISD